VPELRDAEPDRPLEGRVRLHLDFTTPEHLAAFIRYARDSGKFGSDVDAVPLPGDASAEAQGIHHQFLMVPEVKPEHGARITELCPLPAPPAAEASPPPPGPPLREGGTPAPW
jgi:hypothetical protein